MRRMRLFLTVLVSLTFVFAAVSGCGKKKEADAPDESSASVESEPGEAAEETSLMDKVPEGGGLIHVTSSPAGAGILLGGQDLGVKTPYNIALEAGTYTLTVGMRSFTSTPESLVVEVGDGTSDTLSFKLEGEALSSYLLVGKREKEVWPDWSPDGKMIAFEAYYGNNRDIYVISADGGDATRLTFDRKADFSPCWTADSKEIVFTSNRDGTVDLWIVSASGGEPRKLAEGPGAEEDPACSPDGEWIAFSSLGKIWKVPLQGGEMEQVTTGQEKHFQPAWSPDGKEIAFTAKVDNGRQIWAVNVRSGDTRKIVADKGWSYGPQWHPSGKVIAFARRSGHGPDANHDLWVVAVEGGQLTQLTMEGEVDQFPCWAPSGDRLVWTRQADLRVMTKIPEWLQGE